MVQLLQYQSAKLVLIFALSLIVEVYNKIAETSKVRSKYKFVKICSKSLVPDIQDIPSCQYHVLPNDTLCDECVLAERVTDQLKAWNEALREVSKIYSLPINLCFILNNSTQFLEIVYQMKVRWINFPI